jgi:Kelch motif
MYAVCRNGPQPRGGHSFVYDKGNDRFIAFGGLTSGNDVEVCVNDTYQLTLEKKTSGSGNGTGSAGSLVAVWKKLRCSGSLPSPRWCHSGVLQGDDMFVFGGWSYERTEGAGSGSKFFNDVHILNITTLVWTQVDTSGSAPRPRCQCACFLFEKKTISSERKAICDSDSDEAENDINSMLKSSNLIESDTSAIVQYAEQLTTLHSDLPFDSSVATSGYISRISGREGLRNHDVDVIGHNELHISKTDANAQLSPDLYLSNEMQSLSHTKCDSSIQGEVGTDAWLGDEEVSGLSQFQGVKVSGSDDSAGGTTSMTLSLSLPASIASSSLSGTPKYSKASRGYMVIYGGSCHNQEVRPSLTLIITALSLLSSSSVKTLI